MFSCEYCEIVKNNYFEEHLQTAVSVYKQMRRFALTEECYF